MNIIGLIIGLVSGAVGGNVAGRVMPNKSFGTLGDSLAGIFGGGIGAAILHFFHLLPADAGNLDLVGILTHVATGGVGGAVVLVVASLLKNVVAGAKA